MREARWNQDKKCEACGKSFTASRSDARSCGPTCKKRLQRGTKNRRSKYFDGISMVGTLIPLATGDVPFVAAATKGTGKPGAGITGQWGHLFRNGKWHPSPYFWKQGRVVKALIMGRWHAGKLNWNSKCGQECYEHNTQLGAAKLRESIILPVETLTEIAPVWQFDVRAGSR